MYCSNAFSSIKAVFDTMKLKEFLIPVSLNPNVEYCSKVLSITIFVLAQKLCCDSSSNIHRMAYSVRGIWQTILGIEKYN